MSIMQSRKSVVQRDFDVRSLQQRLLQEKETKRAQLDERHHYIFQTIADCLGLEKSEIDDFVLDGNQIELLQKFFDANGSSHLVFFYQEPEQDKDAVEHFRVGQSNNRSVGKTNRARLFVTDGKDVPLRGQCLMFIRPNQTKAITDQNIAQETAFMNMNVLDQNGLLPAIQRLMSDIFIPSLKKMDKGWGFLDNQAGQHTREEFINSLESFVGVLVGAQESLNEKVTLKPCDKCNLDTIASSQDYQTLANSSEGLQMMEECIGVWIRQIEQVLAESEQIRREADDIGPRAELDHWKKRMSKFNFLLEQIKGNNVKAVLGVLQAAKSKSLKIWQDIDRRITDAANEAKDNVKFLYTLEKLCNPLYHSDPVGMLESIPGLIDAIRMIHSISRYYNTSERMTSLFIGITNQMITASKAYITASGTETVWTQASELVIRKLNDCIKLHSEYYGCFEKTKARLEEMPNERKFDFPKMHIFGKFDTFSRRLRKIIEMFQTMELYSHLQDSKIEGMELMANKFQVIVTSMKKKPYDYLDQRKMEFDQDFDEFKRQIGELHNAICTFMDQRFDHMHSTQRALWLLQKFENIGLPNLGIQEKYQKILMGYMRDIEAVSKMYQKQKAEPPVARDLPPIAGKITWARHLFRRIQEPMEAFQQYPTILQSAEAKRIVRAYNKVAKVLLEYEVLFHRAWLREVEVAKSGLEASLLIKHPETSEVFVNFDPQILSLIRETECMARLGLEIPPIATMMRSMQQKFKDLHGALNMMLQENRRVRSKIPQAFGSLVGRHVAVVDRALEPGLSELTWSSIGVEEYMTNVHRKLADFELLMCRANDLVEFRIEAVLREMSTTMLCELPEEEPWPVDRFLEHTQILCAKAARALQMKSVNVQDAAHELIDLLLGGGYEDDELKEKNGEEIENNDEGEHRDGTDDDKSPTESHPTISRGTSRHSRPTSTKANVTIRKKRDSREQMEEAAAELLTYFNNRNLDSVIKVVRNTLENLRKRMTSSGIMHFMDFGNGDSRRDHRTFFRCNVVLAIPNIIMQPSLEEVQQALTKAVHYIINVSKGISQWDRQRKGESKELTERANSVEPPATTERRLSVSSNAPSDSASELHASRGDEKAVATVIVTQPRNYYAQVSEHREIARLVSQLATSISSNKKEVQTALEKFFHYNVIWEKDRDREIEEFMKQDPRLSEFEAQIRYYLEFEQQIFAEDEHVDVGAIGLYTGI